MNVTAMRLDWPGETTQSSVDAGESVAIPLESVEPTDAATATVGDPSDAGESGAVDPRTETDAETLDDILSVVTDQSSRDLLRATGEQNRSASELASACDLPLSTTYRKLARLTEAGLLAEQTRVCTDGRHTSEYALAVRELSLTVHPDDGVELRVTPRE